MSTLRDYYLKLQEFDAARGIVKFNPLQGSSAGR